MTALRHFLLAVQFFTRLPVTGRLGQWVGFEPEGLERAMAYLPAVGWLVGGVAAVVFALVLQLYPDQVLAALLAALLSTGATIALTGAFHEDGLADTADALGGSASTERALQIMKDSRLGSYGSITLALSLGCKIILLAMIAGGGLKMAVAALLAGHVLSRVAPLVLISTLPYVRPAQDSKSGGVVQAARDRIGPGAGLWALPALALLLWCFGWRSVGLCLLAWLLMLGYMWRLQRRRLGGHTGDTLGATQQTCELAIYLALGLA